MGTETISIDHSAALKNAEELASIAVKIDSIRKKLQECARNDIPPAFVCPAGKAGKETAPAAITQKLLAEMNDLHDLSEKITEVGEKMREISKTLDVDGKSTTA